VAGGTAAHSEALWSKKPQYRNLPPTGEDPTLLRIFAVEGPFGGLGRMAALTMQELATSWARARAPPGSSSDTIQTISSRRLAYINTWLTCSVRRLFALDLLHAADRYDADDCAIFNEALDSTQYCESDVMAAIVFQRRGAGARHE